MSDSTELYNLSPAREDRPIAVWRPAFLSALGCNGNVSEAARLAGIARDTAYKAYDARPDFAEEWDAALEIAADVLEREAWRRAVEGGRTYKFHPKTGQPLRFPEGHSLAGQPYYEMVYSDALLTLLLKAHRPDKFKDRSAVETEVKTPQRYDLSKLNEEELTLLESLTRKATPDAALPQ